MSFCENSEIESHILTQRFKCGQKKDRCKMFSIHGVEEASGAHRTADTVIIIKWCVREIKSTFNTNKLYSWKLFSCLSSIEILCDNVY